MQYNLSTLEAIISSGLFTNSLGFIDNFELAIGKCLLTIPTDFAWKASLKSCGDLQDERKRLMVTEAWIKTKIIDCKKLEAQNNSAVSSLSSGVASISLKGGTNSSSKTVEKETEVTKSTLAGDVNGDGDVNNTDLLRLLEYLSGEKVEIDSNAADVNKDGVIDEKDLLSLVESLTGTPSATETYPLIGDINGDEDLTNEDLRVLISYLKGDEIEINGEVADINYDGVTDIQDLIALTQIITGATISTDEISMEIVDVNEDGIFDEEDLTTLAKYLVGETSSIYSEKVDINKDQKVNEEDLQALTQYLIAATVSTGETEQKLIGDVNGDGIIDYDDVERLFEYVQKKDVTIVEALADVNGDGKISAQDVTLLMQIYQELETSTTSGNETAQKIMGDINGDGVINNEDIERLFDYVQKKDVTIEEALADLNGDGKIDTKDVTRLQQLYESQQNATARADVNGDYTVNIEDVAQIVKYINGKEISVEASKLDINGDGKIDTKDALELMRFITGATTTSYTTSCSAIGEIIYKTSYQSYA